MFYVLFNTKKNHEKFFFSKNDKQICKTIIECMALITNVKCVCVYVNKLLKKNLNCNSIQLLLYENELLLSYGWNSGIKPQRSYSNSKTSALKTTKIIKKRSFICMRAWSVCITSIKPNYQKSLPLLKQKEDLIKLNKS